MKGKIRWKKYGQMIILALVVLLLSTISYQNYRKKYQTPEHLGFTGEYSQNDGEWTTLTEDTRLSALDGDITIRGHFERDINKGVVMHFYLHHIGASISVNGQNIYYASTMKYVKVSTCGKNWAIITSPGITTKDEIVIRLHNPHKFGNINAYEEFFEHAYTGNIVSMQKYLDRESGFFEIGGFIVMFCSLILLGLALAFTIMKVEYKHKLWELGLICLMAGMYIMMDTINRSYLGDSIAFSTYSIHLCLMMIVFEFVVFICERITTPRAKMLMRVIAVIEGVFIGVLALFCMSGKYLLYDMLPYWVILQLIICPFLIGCLIYNHRERAEERKDILISCLLLIIALIVDMVNSRFGWWTNGYLAKIVFFILFAFHFVGGLKTIPEGYNVAMKVKALDDELQNSRTVIAMSQIRTHFVFNILNAISGMCKYAPEKADETVVRFARFLRTNVDIMSNDGLVTFEKAMEHLEDYIALEQVRFGDKIHFHKEIEADNFLIPSLILQPIVENSIKHGLTPKVGGGNVWLRTWMDEKNIFIEIKDDGVGFKRNALEKKGAVGLENVRFRLKHLMQGTMKTENNESGGAKVTLSIPITQEEG